MGLDRIRKKIWKKKKKKGKETVRKGLVENGWLGLKGEQNNIGIMIGDLVDVGCGLGVKWRAESGEWRVETVDGDGWHGSWLLDMSRWDPLIWSAQHMGGIGIGG